MTELNGLSAESVYDLLAVNLGKYRRMVQHDILFGPPPKGPIFYMD